LTYTETLAAQLDYCEENLHLLDLQVRDHRITEAEYQARRATLLQEQKMLQELLGQPIEQDSA